MGCLNVLAIVSHRAARHRHRRAIIWVGDPSKPGEFQQAVAARAESILKMPPEAWYVAEEWQEFGWSDTDKPTPEMLAVSLAASEVARAEYAKGNKAAAEWIMESLS